MINAAINEDGTKADRTLESASKALGINASATKQIFQNAISDVEKNATAFGEKHLGLPMKEVFEHLTTCSKMYRTSVYIRLLNSDLSVFPELAENHKLKNKF
ncbi:uncharacterized protein Dmul_37850 [Desulfococcus multivorans]|nr:uncharacterized protein Dmul_37850 [Desulfococcus multivorans]